MSETILTHIRKFISLGSRKALLAALVASAALEAGSLYAQQPTAPTTAPSTQQPLAPDASQVGYADTDPDVRLQQLETTVAQQQLLIKDLSAQMQSGGSADGGAAQITNPTPSIYPGGAAPGPAITGASVVPYVIGSDRALQGSWTNDGPYFTSKNKDFTFHPRFVSQLDFIGVHQPKPNIGVPGANAAGAEDSVNFRRLRIGCDGTMWDTIDYVMEADYAFAEFNTDPSTSSLQATGLRNTGTTNQFGGVAGVQSGNVITPFQPTTTFLTFKEVPVAGNIRIGNQQDWISLEHIESARFLDFMERSALMDAFYGPNNNGYDPGISTFRSFMDQNLNVQLGAYKSQYYDSGFPYDIGNGNYTYGGRMHGTPFYDEATNGRYLVHVGCGFEQREFNHQLNANMNGDNVRIRTRGAMRNVPSTLDPNYTDTGNFYANGQSVIDPEFAIQMGSLLIQGEYTYCRMQGAATQQGGTALHNVHFTGGYVEGLYFLTGESRSYNRLSGVFGRTIPNQNAFLVKRAGFGKGAWQVGMRYDWIYLNSGGTINGGNMDGLTLGLNWWINPNCRFQINYAAEHINNAAAAPGVAIPAGSGVLAGSKFTGEGIINVFGIRQDFSF